MIPKYRHVAETEVFVSSSLRDVVAGSSLEFHDHGLHRLKGIENEWRLYSLVSVEGKRCPEPLDRVEASERRLAFEPAADRPRPRTPRSSAASSVSSWRSRRS